MSNESDTAKSQQLTPPYVSWKTELNLLKDLHDHGVPSRIDRSVLTKFSGTVRAPLMTALKFKRLITPEGDTTPKLTELVKSYGTPKWKQLLSEVVRESFAGLMTLDLANATPVQFSEKFKGAYPGTDAVQSKCRAYFLAVATEAGIEISPRILKGRKERAPNIPRKPKAAAASGQPNGTKSKPNQPRDNAGGGATSSALTAPTSYQLLTMLEPSMSKDEQDAVWLLIQYAKKKEAAERMGLRPARSSPTISRCF